MNKTKKHKILGTIIKMTVTGVVIISIGIGMACILLFDTFPSSFH